jgi:hypothetical protein
MILQTNLAIGSTDFIDIMNEPLGAKGPLLVGEEVRKLA